MWMTVGWTLQGRTTVDYSLMPNGSPEEWLTYPNT